MVFKRNFLGEPDKMVPVSGIQIEKGRHHLHHQNELMCVLGVEGLKLTGLQG